VYWQPEPDGIKLKFHVPGDAPITAQVCHD
jgi:hypothetical protein